MKFQNIDYLVQEYVNQTKMNQNHIPKVHFTSRMRFDCIRLAKEPVRKQEFRDVPDDGWVELCGTCIWPIYTYDKTIIVINKKYINIGQPYSTIPHELTHCKDYYEFADRCFEGNILAMQYDYRFKMFKSVSEYWATYWGSKYFRKYTLSRDDIIDKDLNIKNIEAYTNILLQDGLSVDRFNNDKFYALFRYLGRIKVWSEDIGIQHNDLIPKSVINLFGERVYDLNDMLKTCDSLDDFLLRYGYLHNTTEHIG